MWKKAIALVIGSTLWVLFITLVCVHGLRFEASSNLYHDQVSTWEEAYHKQVHYSRYLEDRNRELEAQLNSITSTENH